jgi:hypothetical protein
MENPIPNSNLFATPKSMEELEAYANSMDNTSQAYLMLGFALNYCHSLVNEELAKATA